jgi:fructose-specific component phosphotransferase system IIB-like protein
MQYLIIVDSSDISDIRTLVQEYQDNSELPKGIQLIGRQALLFEEDKAFLSFANVLSNILATGRPFHVFRIPDDSKIH